MVTTFPTPAEDELKLQVNMLYAAPPPQEDVTFLPMTSNCLYKLQQTFTPGMILCTRSFAASMP